MNYTFIESDQELAQVCAKLAQEPIIGVDLEADSMHCFQEKICLIQIATETEAFLVDPFIISNFTPFSAILENPDIIKIFHGSDFDVRSIDRELHVRIHNLFDSEIACRFLNVRERGLAALLKENFDVYVDKKFQKVDWSKRPLKEDMIAYSVEDVAHLVKLHRILVERLEKINRYHWAKEEFQAQSRVKYESNHTLPLFKKFKGAGRMDNRSLAVLESLLQVRLKMAEKKDLPLFKIMSNQSIMTMATQRPKNPGEMVGIKALSKRQAGMYGGLCVEAIRTALALPHGELPSYPRTRRPRKTPKVMERIKRLKQMRERCSQSIGMEPGFVINNSMISTL
ncbi:MAG: HRDC domain-containing protein, partial [Desulfobacterales bacterium]|nr:HRDC domain-containing protein [Desulfobacterales bacterium]